MALNISANYQQFGHVAVPLSITSPSGYEDAVLRLRIDLGQNRGRLVGRVAGGTAGVWTPLLGRFEVKGTAAKINSVLSSLTYYSSTSGNTPSFSGAVTLFNADGTEAETGVINLTHVDIYADDNIEWTAPISVKHIQYTPNATYLPLVLPPVTQNDATLYMLTVQAKNAETGAWLSDASVGTFADLESDRFAGRWTGGRLSFYGLTDAVNEALGKLLYQPPAGWEGWGKFTVTVADGKTDPASHDLFYYANPGSVAGLSQSYELTEDAYAPITLSPITITGPHFHDGSCNYKATIQLSKSDAGAFRTGTYGDLTTTWIEGTDQSGIIGVTIADGTHGRKGGYRYVVGDSVRIEGGTATNAATVRIDAVGAPFQIPFYLLTDYISASGSGYAVGDVVRINFSADFGAENACMAKVSSVDANGAVTGLHEDQTGGGSYQSAPWGYATTENVSGSMSGSGLTMEFPTVAAGRATAVSIISGGDYDLFPDLANAATSSLTGSGFWLELDLEASSLGKSRLIMEGKRDDVNAALANLVFDPNEGASKSFYFQCTITNPLGLAASNTIPVTVIEVPDVPTANNINTTHTWTEDQTYSFSPAIKVIDDDSNETITVTMTLSAATGTLNSLTGGSWNGSTRTWTCSGSVEAVNNILTNLQFTPNANADQDFAISVSVRDAAGTGPDGSITMTCQPVADPLVMTTPSNVTYQLAETAVHGFYVSDVDTADTLTIDLAMSVAAGTLASVNGGYMGGNTFTATGSVTQVNNILSTLKFTPATIGSFNVMGVPATINWTEDQSFGLPSISVAQTGQFSNPFTVTVTGNSNANENVTRTVAFQPASTSTDSVTFRVTYPTAVGTWTVPVSYTTSNPEIGKTTIEITGTASAVSNAVSGMVFNPASNYEQSFAIEWWASNGTDVWTSTTNCAVTSVNDPHTATGISGAHSYDSRKSYVFPAITVTDPDAGQRYTVTATLGNLEAGTLTASDGTGFDPATGKYTISGTWAEIGSKLSGLVFTPKKLGDFALPDVADVNYTEDTPVALTTLRVVNDTYFNEGFSIAVTVTDIEGQHTETGTWTMSPNTPGETITVEIRYPDAGGIMTWTNLSGVTALSSVEEGIRVITISGSDAAVNTVLSSFVFNPSADSNQNVDVYVDASDSDGNRVGKPFNLLCTPVNDLYVPAGFQIDEDTSFAYASDPVRVDDALVGSTYDIVITLSTADGSFNQPSFGGKTAVWNASTRKLTISDVTKDEANGLLPGLVFTPLADYYGSLNATYTLTNKTTGVVSSVSRPITVNPVNDDVPVITTGSETFDPMVSKTLAAVSVTDADGHDPYGFALEVVVVTPNGGTFDPYNFAGGTVSADRKTFITNDPTTDGLDQSLDYLHFLINPNGANTLALNGATTRTWTPGYTHDFSSNPMTVVDGQPVSGNIDILVRVKDDGGRVGCNVTEATHTLVPGAWVGGEMEVGITIDPAAGSFSVSAPSGGTWARYIDTGYLRLRGTEAQINDMLATLVFSPTSGYASDFNVKVQVYTTSVIGQNNQNHRVYKTYDFTMAVQA